MTALPLLAGGVLFLGGLVVGWCIGYDDGKQMMRDAHGLPAKRETGKP